MSGLICMFCGNNIEGCICESDEFMKIEMLSFFKTPENEYKMAEPDFINDAAELDLEFYNEQTTEPDFVNDIPELDLEFY